MRSILFWLYILLSAVVYAQELIIAAKDINSLIPQGFVKDFNLNSCENASRKRTVYSENTAIKQSVIRYTYHVYDIAIKDISDKVRNNFFAGSIFVARDKNNSAHLIEPYNTHGYITRENIVRLLNDMSQNEYVLFMEFYKFGDIEGYENRDTIIGWNNMNAVIFITTVDPAARTQSGITIGSTREEVIRVYGEEYLATENRIQYINSDFELVGMIFYFENNRVIRITCFTHI